MKVKKSRKALQTSQDHVSKLAFSPIVSIEGSFVDQIENRRKEDKLEKRQGLKKVRREEQLDSFDGDADTTDDDHNKFVKEKNKRFT